MTKEQIKIACAELDGWDNISDGFGDCVKYGGTESESVVNLPIPNYPESYDAILPLIQKQDKMVICAISRRIFKEYSEEGYGKISMLQATAMQLCVNLLKATGKWKE